MFMNRFLTGLSMLSCTLLLCTSFATASSLANGIVMGKVIEIPETCTYLKKEIPTASFATIRIL